MVDGLLQNFGVACPKIKEFHNQLRDCEMFKNITASSDLRLSWLIFVETFWMPYLRPCSPPLRCK